VFTFVKNQYYPMKSFFVSLIVFVLMGAGQLKSQTVYITDKGKKYHAKNCPVAKKGKKGIPLQEAKKLGLRPCKMCKIEDLIAEEEKQKKAKNQEKKN
jgi:hypothetical protein